MLFIVLLGCLLVLLWILSCLYRFMEESFSCKIQKELFWSLSFIGITLLMIRFSFQIYRISFTWLYEMILFASTYFFLIAIFLWIGYGCYRIMKYFRKHTTAKSWFLMALSFSLVFTTFGLWQAEQIQKREYTISMQGLQEDMDIMVVSDLHISTSIKEKEIKEMFTTLSNENATALFLIGDVFDESTRDQDMKVFCEYAKQTKVPMYYVIGNHEGLAAHETKYLTWMKESGIHVMEDEVSKYQQLQIVGRKDRSTKRKSLSEMKIDLTLPTIVLDHHPVYDEIQNNNVIQVSGHTHNGQIFPNNIITGIAYPQLYGLYKESYPMIVSSGYGTWGFPMRIGSQNEYVILHLKA